MGNAEDLLAMVTEHHVLPAILYQGPAMPPIPVLLECFDDEGPRVRFTIESQDRSVQMQLVTGAAGVRMLLDAPKPREV